MTTGNSLLSSIELLKDKSIINDVLVFVDREQEYRRFIKKYNINIHRIISMDKIFEILYSKQ